MCYTCVHLLVGKDGHILPDGMTQKTQKTGRASGLVMPSHLPVMPIESEYVCMYLIACSQLKSRVLLQQVRSSALELLGSMYHRLGPPMKALVPELRAALQSQVHAGLLDLPNSARPFLQSTFPKGDLVHFFLFVYGLWGPRHPTDIWAALSRVHR